MRSKIRKMSLGDKVNILEVEPGYNTVIIREKEKNNYRLWFPYIVYIIREHIGRRKTMHVGLRTAPLGKDLLEQTLMYPPVPQIYCCWLLACSQPSIEGFWGSPFSNWSSWPCNKLMMDTGLLSYNNWQSMSPKDLVPIFCNWPETIKFRYGKFTGLWEYGNADLGVNAFMPVKVPLKECLGHIPDVVLDHVLEVSQ